MFEFVDRKCKSIIDTHINCRVPGVIVDKSKMDSYSPPRLGKSLKLADYGCALAHIAAWRRVIAGSHDWVVVMEDDAEFVDDVDLTK